MKKIFFVLLSLILLIIGLGLLLNLSLVSSHGDFAETKQLIDSGISCDKLTDEELETMGDYYMEQMHPGEAHEIMDNMMGGEGSESLKQVHINMAKRLYCNENIYIGYGMMSSGGMMNMMNNFIGYEMMSGRTGYGGIFFGWIIWLIYKFARKGKESETPISILQKRYAKGEINKKQFEKMKKEIGSDNHGKR